MKELRLSKQFRKDFKRYRHNQKAVKNLNEILEILMEGRPIPVEYNPHFLKGQYKGCMECHIGPDYLLIWKDETTDIIYLVRLGSHSELFE